MRFVSLFALITLACSSIMVSAGEILPAPVKVSEHVYAWIGPFGGPTKENKGYRMNMAFVVGSDSVAVLETGYTEPMAREMLHHIANVTDAPVKYAINSNSRPDRFMGNDVFRESGAEIIAHELEILEMEKLSGGFAQGIESTLGLAEGAVNIPALPDRVIDESIQFDLGGVEIAVHHFGAAHTPAPLVVNIIDDNVVYAGDILYSGRLLAIILGGSIKEWIITFDALKQFKDALFIPGHGNPAPLSDFKFSTREYLALLDQHMTKMVEDIVDIQEAIDRLDQSLFSKLANFDDLAGRNASRAYLEAEQRSF